MSYNLRPGSAFWWAAPTGAVPQLRRITILFVNMWHGAYQFLCDGETHDGTFDDLEVTIFNRYPVWDPESGCYVPDLYGGRSEPPQLRPAQKRALAQGEDPAGTGTSSRRTDSKPADQAQKAQKAQKAEKTEKTEKPVRRPSTVPVRLALKAGDRLWYLRTPEKPGTLITVLDVNPSRGTFTALWGNSRITLSAAQTAQLSAGRPIYLPETKTFVPDAPLELALKSGKH